MGDWTERACLETTRTPRLKIRTRGNCRGKSSSALLRNVVDFFRHYGIEKSFRSALWRSTPRSDAKLRVNNPRLMFREGWNSPPFELVRKSNLIVEISELINEIDALIVGFGERKIETRRWARTKETNEGERITVKPNCGALFSQKLSNGSSYCFFIFIDFHHGDCCGDW